MLGVAPQLDIASNLYLGREIRKKGILGTVFRMLDLSAMRRQAAQKVADLGIITIQDITQAVETLSGGQRQAVAVARAAAFGSKVLIMDRGLPIIFISHNMPILWELADRIQILRLGRRVAVLTPGTSTMEEVVALMTGAKTMQEQ
jgi:fructose transport system ATP-binding protein